MRVELEHRRRYRDVKTAQVVAIASNVWEVRLPRDDMAVQASRRPWTLEGWDGAVLVLDGAEAEPAVASRIDSTVVTLTAIVLS